MKKYKVTQKFMEELTKWRYEYATEFDIVRLSYHTIEALPEIAEVWWTDNNPVEANKRVAAIFNWTSGEDVFEVVTTKYIVKRTRNPVLSDVDEYVSLNSVGSTFIANNEKDATRFITFEKASEWANKHFKVVEVDE